MHGENRTFFFFGDVNVCTNIILKNVIKLSRLHTSYRTASVGTTSIINSKSIDGWNDYLGNKEEFCVSPEGLSTLIGSKHYFNNIKQINFNFCAHGLSKNKFSHLDFFSDMFKPLNFTNLIQFYFIFSRHSFSLCDFHHMKLSLQ